MAAPSGTIPDIGLDPFAQMTRADDNFGDAFARQDAKLMSYERLICDID
jgi:hypothetical protein